MIVLVFIAAALALIGFAFQLNDIYRSRQREIEECEPHRWEWRSIDKQDRGYTRHCIDCRHQEPVKLKDVPEEVRAEVLAKLADKRRKRLG